MRTGESDSGEVAFELRSEDEQEVERAEHSRQREQHDEGPEEGGSPEPEDLCSWNSRRGWVLGKCLASSAEIRCH